MTRFRVCTAGYDDDHTVDAQDHVDAARRFVELYYKPGNVPVALLTSGATQVDVTKLNDLGRKTLPSQRIRVRFHQRVSVTEVQPV